MKVTRLKEIANGEIKNGKDKKAMSTDEKEEGK